MKVYIEADVSKDMEYDTRSMIHVTADEEIRPTSLPLWELHAEDSERSQRWSVLESD